MVILEGSGLDRDRYDFCEGIASGLITVGRERENYNKTRLSEGESIVQT